jgi:glycosyltransferase involved in cell wall biosynthesis
LDGVTGFACNVGDVEDMTAKAKFILAEENLPGFKERALARAKEFDIDQILPKYVAYYEKTIAATLSAV